MTSEEAIDILKTHYHKNPRTTYGFKVKQATEMAVEALQERKTGKWIDMGCGQECSCCGEVQYGYDNRRQYCPFCGAKMEVGDGDSN